MNNTDNPNHDIQPRQTLFNWFARYDESAEPSQYQVRFNRSEELPIEPNVTSCTGL